MECIASKVAPAKAMTRVPWTDLIFHLNERLPRFQKDIHVRVDSSFTNCLRLLNVREKQRDGPVNLNRKRAEKFHQCVTAMDKGKMRDAKDVIFILSCLVVQENFKIYTYSSSCRCYEILKNLHDHKSPYPIRVFLTFPPRSRM